MFENLSVLLMALFLFLFAAIYVGKLGEKIKIPKAIVFSVVGVLLGIFLYLINIQEKIALKMLLNITLGFIAFMIGLEINFNSSKPRLKEIFIITIFETLATILITSIFLFVFKLPIHIVLVIGAIMIATEPGAILYSIKRYRAKGLVSETLVVSQSFQNIITILIFGITLSVATTIEANNTFKVVEIFKDSALELIFSIGIAFILGYILNIIARNIKRDDSEQELLLIISSIVLIIFSVALANIKITLYNYHINISPVLLPLVIGITFTNTTAKDVHHKTKQSMDLFGTPFVILFFLLLGETLFDYLINFKIDKTIIIIALVLIITRFVGKYSGAFIGGKIAKSTENIQRYLGFGLLPQGLVALGLAFIASSKLTNYSDIILMVVVISVFVYSIIGLFGIWFSLYKTKEIDESYFALELKKVSVIKRRRELEQKE